jgi:hypothetical protein
MSHRPSVAVASAAGAGSAVDAEAAGAVKVKYLAENAAIAIREAAEVTAWWKERSSRRDLEMFVLQPRDVPSLELHTFFSTMTLAGQATSVVGCQWRSVYRPTSGEAAAADHSGLAPFIRENFFRLCQQRRPGGAWGGFLYDPVLCQPYSGEAVAPAAADPRTVPVPLSTIGTRYQWAVYACDVFDFFRWLPGMKPLAGMTEKLVRVSAYDLIHEDYSEDLLAPEESALAKVCFGYSFLPCPVVPNFFGWGPGQFRSAIKQFRFAVLPNGSLEVRMLFIAAPRSEKVVNFWGFDPVYTSIKLANALTFGAFDITRRGHDFNDKLFMAHHGRVYQALIEGMKATWVAQDWVGGKTGY